MNQQQNTLGKYSQRSQPKSNRPQYNIETFNPSERQLIYDSFRNKNEVSEYKQGSVLGGIQGESFIQQNENDDNTNGWYTEIFSWGSDQSGQLGLGQQPIGKSYPLPRYCTYNIGIKQVSCGDEHAAFITINHLLYSMGSNEYGQLGVNDPTIKQKNSPILIESIMDKKPINISCGSFHTAFCTDNGEAYTWGQGQYGALGVVSLVDQHQPMQVKFSMDTSIIQVSCGGKHTAFLDHQGKLFTCGNGEAGCLGNGQRLQENFPTLIPKLSEKIKMVSCGQLHTLILMRSGNIYACGANSFGQLGLGNKRGSSVPIIISDISHIPMRYVAAGSFSAAISKEQGDLYIWGSGVFGEFLTPHRVKTINGMTIEVSIGNHFGAAISKDGQIYTWGQNSNGELGQNEFEEKAIPKMVKSLSDRVVTSIACGRNFAIALGQTLKQGESPVRQININIAGDRFSPIQQNNYQSNIDLNNQQLDRLNRHSFDYVAQRNSFDQNLLQLHKIKSNSKKKKKSTQKKSVNKTYNNIQQYNNISGISSHKRSRHDYTPLRISPRTKSQNNGHSNNKQQDISFQSQQQCQRCKSHHHKKHCQGSETKRKKPKKLQEDNTQPSTPINYHTTPSKKHNNNLLLQIEINRQVNQELEKEKELTKLLKYENKDLEDKLHSINNQNRKLKQELKGIENQLQLQQDSRRKQQKYDMIENDYEKQLQVNQQQQSEIRSLYTKISELELMLDKKHHENLKNESLMVQYTDNLKHLESQYKSTQHENQQLREQNVHLKDQLDKERYANDNVHLIQQQYEEEIQRRKQAERELERVRNEYYEHQGEQSQETTNLRKAIDDIRYQNEENIRVIGVKEDEIRYLKKEIQQLQEFMEKKDSDTENLKDVIRELEEKNRKLDEKINSIIYNKAHQYKQRTYQALGMNNQQSPDSKHLTSQKYNNDYTNEKYSQQRTNNNSPQRTPDGTSANYKIYKELERIELSKSPNPRAKNEYGSQDQQLMSATNRGSQININELYHYRSNSNASSAYQNSSPLRQKVAIKELLNAQTQSPSQQQKQQKDQQYVHNERVKHSCEKLASALGIQTMATSNGFFEKANSNTKQQQPNDSDLFSSGQTFNNQSYYPAVSTGMTSSMIKKSLSDLRSKLDVMRKDKQAVESGMSEYEARQQQM